MTKAEFVFNKYAAALSIGEMKGLINASNMEKAIDSVLGGKLTKGEKLQALGKAGLKGKKQPPGTLNANLDPDLLKKIKNKLQAKQQRLKMKQSEPVKTTSGAATEIEEMAGNYIDKAKNWIQKNPGKSVVAAGAGVGIPAYMLARSGNNQQS